MLAQRLGKANTKRRQLLVYHKNHADKSCRSRHAAVEKAMDMPKEPVKDNSSDLSSEESRIISAEWTQDATASTTSHQEIDVASDLRQTKFPATTASNQALALMPPPPEKTVSNIPFLCPFCRQTIQLEDMDEYWSCHVYSDLRSYICTFGNCVTANQLYDSYTEWCEHEWQFHRREWFCNFCSYTCQSEAFFWKHLENAHAGTLPEDQR